MYCSLLAICYSTGDELWKQSTNGQGIEGLWHKAKLYTSLNTATKHAVLICSTVLYIISMHLEILMWEKRL